MNKAYILLFVVLIAFFVIPYEKSDVKTVTNYPLTASNLIRSSEQVRIVLFEMRYYEEYPNSKTNLLLEELKDHGNVKIIIEGGEDYLGDDFREKQLKVVEFFENSSVKIRCDPENVTTHSKLVVGDEKVLIGSTNWNYYAFQHNNEANVLIQSKYIAQSYRNYFNDLWEKSSKCL